MRAHRDQPTITAHRPTHRLATTRTRVTDRAAAAGAAALGGAPPPLGRLRRGRARWRIPLPVSIALHGAILFLLLYVVHRKELSRPQPESAIAVVFQNTGLKHTAKKTAAPKAEIHAPPRPASRPLPPPMQPAVPAPLPVLPPKPAPNPIPKPVPKPAPHPAPAPSPPPAVHLNLPSPAQPTMQAEIIPKAPPQPKPQPDRSAAAHATPNAQSVPRYAMMTGMSFGNRPSTALEHENRALNLAPAQSDLDNQAPDITFKGKAGPDWESEFRKWVNEHDYYPTAAAQQGQQGSVTVSFDVHPNGKVTGVHLVSSSGAPLLDMAWYGLFNGAHVPKFPPGSKAKSEHVVATIHFILIH